MIWCGQTAGTNILLISESLILPAATSVSVLKVPGLRLATLLKKMFMNTFSQDNLWMTDSILTKA